MMRRRGAVMLLAVAGMLLTAAVPAPVMPLRSSLIAATRRCREAHYIASISGQIDALDQTMAAKKITDIRQESTQLAALMAALDHQEFDALVPCVETSESPGVVSAAADYYGVWATINARAAAAQSQFQTYSGDFLQFAQSSGATPAERAAAVEAITFWCDRHKPEQGYLYPDYGRALTWPQWHVACDGKG